MTVKKFYGRNLNIHKQGGLFLLKIISGAALSDREEIFVGDIKNAAQNGENILVIVPDQFSFEYDKMLYEHMGAQLFNTIRTTGFNRLAELIAEKYGCASKENANDNAKLILMFKAVRRFSKSGKVKFYKNSLDKGSFISELITLFSQLRESGITAQDLQVAAERLEGSVSLKLFDLSAILAFYSEELEAANMNDSLSLMNDAVRLAKDNGYFEGMSVYVSAFSSFSYDEKRMLEECMRSAKSLTVSLLLDDESAAGYTTHPFAVAVRTRQFFTDLANAQGVPVSLVCAEDKADVSADIKYLGKKIFDFARTRYEVALSDVRLYSADDIYEESDFICAEICRLVRDKNYRFNDIAVTVRDLSAFSPVISGVLERYDIPYYIDKRDSVDASAIVHYINAVFRVVLTKKFKTENIMKLIKSPLFSMLNYEISDLEDYCIRWGVEGDMWLSPFTAAFGGEKQLERINELRERVISPLVKFKTACEDKSAAEISRAFYELLGDIKLSEQTYSMVKRASLSDNETETELARGLKQLWSMSLSAVKSIYEILGDDKITLRKYYELYSLMLSQMKISNPPQKLDCVRIMDASHSRMNAVKIVFAAEVNDGIFPANVKGGGLVTEHEKELLRVKENIVIEANVLNDFQNEKLIAYTALCSAEDRLYVSYSNSDLLGKKKRPSSLVKEIQTVLGAQITAVSTLPADFFCTSYKTAYTKYIEHSREKSSLIQSIYESMMTSAEYFDKAGRLRNLNSAKNYKLDPKTAESAFFGKGTATVSPTKLDNYFKCPFMYFCDYGLKLRKEQRMDIDARNKGQIVHRVLELAVAAEGRTPKENREHFLTMTDEDIRALIDRVFDEYYTEEFCGDFGKTGTFDYRFEKLRSNTFYMVKYVRGELERSGFAPAITEYKIEKKQDGDHLDLKLSDGRKIVLIGTIDRADIYEDENGKKYIRVVDYKYRKKFSFNLAELYCGLELQMLIYLSMLLETDNDLFGSKELLQGGVFYLKLHPGEQNFSEDSELSEDELYKAACESAVKTFNRSGRLTDVLDMNEVLDKDLIPQNRRYVVMSDPLFTAMRIFAKRKVKEYGNRLLKGDIDAKPMKDACTYCNFTGICAKAYPDDPIRGSSKLMETELKKIADEGGEQ